MAAPNDVMTLAEADRRFAGKWLALEVVKRDRQQKPTKVRLIAQARTLAQLCKKTRGVAEAYLHFAGPLVPEGTVILYSASRGDELDLPVQRHPGRDTPRAAHHRAMTSRAVAG